MLAKAAAPVRDFAGMARSYSAGVQVAMMGGPWQPFPKAIA
ncbi:hypothetical protein [Stutzerimonas stutzeri]|nr:hypothetical protein [Stutzerimonas stutzeri]